MIQLSQSLYLIEDTCNVYAIVNGHDAVLIDFGAGQALTELSGIGVTVQDVILTHHHRDQGQNLEQAVAAGVRVWVPHAEQDLVANVDVHWQAREIYNNYNNRQDRFSLREPVAIAGVLRDYETRAFAGHIFQVVPTPGHTTGSITVLAEIDGRHVAFTGDLIAGPGVVWSLAATQWSYNGAEGVPATVASLLDLKDRRPDLLLPSHGIPMDPPGPAIDLLVERLARLLKARGQNPRLFQLREKPYEPITPHLLRHRASMANTYVLLSEGGGALILDFGYDFITGIAAGTDRAARRPWLYTLPALKRDFGVKVIEVALTTHYHDDHVAGLNLLRDVEGAEVWAAETFADILEDPARYDLPCLWPDPIPVDRRLPHNRPIAWREYTFTLHALPGHTRYAVAIALEVDGRRVLVTGDQYQGDDGLEWNYVYANRFDAEDYVRSAELYRRLNPDLILTGHWAPFWVAEHPGYFDRLAELGALLAELHDDLLAPDAKGAGTDGFVAWILPYQSQAQGGEPLEFTAHVRNAHEKAVDVALTIQAPAGWDVPAGPLCLDVQACASNTLAFQVTPPVGLTARRARIALDVTVNGRHLGELAEALISVRPGGEA